MRTCLRYRRWDKKQACQYRLLLLRTARQITRRLIPGTHQRRGRVGKYICRHRRTSTRFCRRIHTGEVCIRSQWTSTRCNCIDVATSGGLPLPVIVWTGQWKTEEKKQLWKEWLYIPCFSSVWHHPPCRYAFRQRWQLPLAQAEQTPWGTGEKRERWWSSCWNNRCQITPRKQGQIVCFSDLRLIGLIVVAVWLMYWHHSTNTTYAVTRLYILRIYCFVFSSLFYLTTDNFSIDPAKGMTIHDGEKELRYHCNHSSYLSIFMRSIVISTTR